MKVVMRKLIAFTVICFLLSCSDNFLELSNIRVEAIDSLEAKKLIPDDQRLPANVRNSDSISVITFDFEKEALESLPDEGGILKVELLDCSDNSLQASSFVYTNKTNVSLSANKQEVLMSAEKAYFFVESSIVENGCFRALFKSMTRSARSAIYQLGNSKNN